MCLSAGQKGTREQSKKSNCNHRQAEEGTGCCKGCEERQREHSKSFAGKELSKSSAYYREHFNLLLIINIAIF